MIINRDITLDVSDNSLTVKVFAKRLDDMKRHLTATIVNGSTPINIPTTTNVIFQGTKPDGKGFMYDCTVNTNGTVDVEICAEVLAVAGIVRCELEMTDTSGVVTTATFKLNVEEKALSPDVVKSKDEFKSLYSMLLECRGYTESIINDAVCKGLNKDVKWKESEYVFSVNANWNRYRIPCKIVFSKPEKR